VIRERGLTVRRFWERWTTDPLFARPKESSDIRRREQTKGFVERYGDVPIFQVGDEIVAEWLAGGGRAGTVMGLSSMFNDAASIKAGRLIDRNPFEKLGISRGKGRRDQQPPSEEKAWEIIAVLVISPAHPSRHGYRSPRSRAFGRVSWMRCGGSGSTLPATGSSSRSSSTPRRGSSTRRRITSAARRR
jgi:hypothetical protein